jgi:hypothetical protein
MLDLKALEAATLAAFNASFPGQNWESLPDIDRDKWNIAIRSAVEEYQRQTLKGYAERIEKKGNPQAG